MTIEKSLQQLGLTEKEARVYLAVLELGQDTVLNIAKRAEIKRPTTYVALDSLIQEGLVRKLPRGTTTLYIAENPDYLLSVLGEKEKAIKNVIPLLKAIYSIDRAKPQIRFYEGKEGVGKIYKELRQAKKYILFYGSIKDIMKYFPESFLTPEQIKEMNIPVKEIVTSDPVDIKYAKKINKLKNPKHKVRTVKKGIFFTLDSAIFDDKIAIISVKKDYFGVIIESKDISHSFGVLYDLAWQSAIKILNNL